MALHFYFRSMIEVLFAHVLCGVRFRACISEILHTRIHVSNVSIKTKKTNTFKSLSRRQPINSFSIAA